MLIRSCHYGVVDFELLFLQQPFHADVRSSALTAKACKRDALCMDVIRCAVYDLSGSTVIISYISNLLTVSYSRH